MCGIVGYVGDRQCSDILLSGLQRLEYRGYDSAGIAIATDSGEVKTRRTEGKLTSLFSAFREDPFDGSIGLGHTRWATHGRPSERNAHPHQAGRVIVAHNGIIENYAELKRELAKQGREFKSETDTEVIAHLIDHALETGSQTLHAAVTRALRVVDGSYALIVMTTDNPEELVVARNASPMVIGREGDQVFAASDVPAVLPYTRDFIYLEDGDTAILSRGGLEVFDAAGEPVERESKRINWDPISAEKQGYKHFMLKEIHEQPARITDTLRGRVSVDRGDVDFGEMGFDEDWLAELNKIVFVACGTSFYAAQVAKYTIEEFARVPVEVDLASEFRYRNPIIDEHTLCIPISQSGETADTLAAMRQAMELGAKSLAVCNVIESTIAREADGVVYTQAGPEIGVASTKAFTTQLVVTTLLAVWLGRRRDILDADRGRQNLAGASRRAPDDVQDAAREGHLQAHRLQLLGRQLVPVSGPGQPVPHRLRGGAQAQGNQLHPRRGLRRRRDEARAHRPDRRAPARGHPGAQKPGLREGV